MIDRPALIAFDGSDGSRRAIAVAAEILGGGRAQVIHAWEPVSSAAARSAVYALAFDDSPELLEEERRRAEEVGQAGVALAREAGFESAGGAVSGSGPLWATIVQHAEEVIPSVIVMGTRGLSGVRSVLQGSVSHGVITHSPFPVLTVPVEGRP